MAIVGREDLDTAEARAREGLLALELALRSGDPTPARRFVTEAFDERIQADLKEAAVNGWRRLTDDLGTVTAQALEATDEAGLQASTVVVGGEGRRGWLDAHGHPVEPVRKGRWSEAWSMVRSADPDHIAAAREGRCQDCGAPVPEGCRRPLPVLPRGATTAAGRVDRAGPREEGGERRGRGRDGGVDRRVDDAHR